MLTMLSLEEFETLETLSRERLHDIACRYNIKPPRENSYTAAKIRHHLTPSVRPVEEFDVPGYGDFVIRVNADVAELYNRFTGRRIIPTAYEGLEGYSFVGLRNAYGKRRVLHFGALVLRSLIGDPPEGQTCDHIDRIRSNNNISNLRWATAGDQVANRGVTDDPSPRTLPVVAVHLDGEESIYASTALAAVDFVESEDDRLTCLTDGIQKAIRTKGNFRGFMWKVGPQVGDSVIEWRPIHEEFGLDPGHMVSRCGLIKEKHGRITAGQLARSGYRKFSGRRVHRIVAGALPRRT